MLPLLLQSKETNESGGHPDPVQRELGSEAFRRRYYPRECSHRCRDAMRKGTNRCFRKIA